MFKLERFSSEIKKYLQAKNVLTSKALVSWEIEARVLRSNTGDIFLQGISSYEFEHIIKVLRGWKTSLDCSGTVHVVTVGTESEWPIFK